MVRGCCCYCRRKNSTAVSSRSPRRMAVLKALSQGLTLSPRGFGLVAPDIDTGASLERECKRWRNTDRVLQSAAADRVLEIECGRSPSPQILQRLILPARAVRHLETAAKLLKLLERVLAVFSKCALKLLDNQVGFDSAIPRFESWRPSQIKALKMRRYLAALLGSFSSFRNSFRASFRNSVPCAFDKPAIRCACRFRVAASARSMVRLA